MVRIVFDLDGTLIDSAADIRSVANAVLAGEGAEPLSLEETRRFVGSGTQVFVARMRAARHIPDSEQARLHDGFMARYPEAVGLTQAYAGVREALEELVQAGHGLGICTNKPIVPTRAVLRHLGLDRFFAVVLGGDSMTVKKPDPAPLNAAFAALGQGPRLYVGDSEVDAETAERAGVPFLLFTEGYRRRPVGELAHVAVFSDWVAVPRLVDASVGHAQAVAASR